MRRLVWILLAAIVLFVVWAGLPYWLPPEVALGPCGKDWTSPSSYLPRASPTRSVRFTVGETEGKICFGSPSARGREVFGGLVPWDELWRTGANEPTRLFLDGPAVVAGISLEAGRYSLYTIPGREAWQLFVSTSTFHWGNQISAAVRSREVGQAVLAGKTGDGHVEELTFTWDGDLLTLEWETTRVGMPIESAD